MPETACSVTACARVSLSHTEGGVMVLTRFSLMAGLSPPRMSFCEAEVNSARPEMGRYSWFRLGSFRMRSSA